MACGTARQDIKSVMARCAGQGSADDFSACVEKGMNPQEVVVSPSQPIAHVVEGSDENPDEDSDLLGAEIAGKFKKLRGFQVQIEPSAEAYHKTIGALDPKGRSAHSLEWRQFDYVWMEFVLLRDEVVKLLTERLEGLSAGDPRRQTLLSRRNALETCKIPGDPISAYHFFRGEELSRQLGRQT